MRPALLLLMVLWSAPANAAHEGLKGLTNVDFIFDELTKDTQDCGGDFDAIRNALVLPLQAYTKLRDTNGAALDYVSKVAAYLRINTIKAPAGCFHSVRLQVFIFIPVRLPHLAADTFEQVMLWDDGRTSAHGLQRAGALEKAIDTLARNLAAAWQEANP
jgi:hypothetical protein